MTQRTTPPFRADHVGSLLRTPKLARARAEWRAGGLDDAKLKDIEERAVEEAVALQEMLGLEAITDGEYRRDYWHLDFLCGFDGIEMWQTDTGGGFKSGNQPPVARVTGKIRWNGGVFTEMFTHLRSVTTRTPKITIPGPAMIHMRPGRSAVDERVYPDLDLMFADLCDAYRMEIQALAELGLTYLQIDDVSLAYLCHEGTRQMMRDRGDDPDDLLELYIGLTNLVLEGRPDTLTVTTHMCRGNFQSSWVAEGGYEPVAEKVLNTLEVDGFFMEYDTDRAGGFEPLRFLPSNKIAVLGLVSTKVPELEDKEVLKRRIDDAARFAPFDNLCLSPQCGFASTREGNKITIDDEKAKLSLVVETAAEVWG